MEDTYNSMYGCNFCNFDDEYAVDCTRKMFEVEHLIYNQWCSQYKSDTDS